MDDGGGPTGPVPRTGAGPGDVPGGEQLVGGPPPPLHAATAVEIPENLRDRLKNVFFGPPLVTEQLRSERLSNPVALGVLSPDCISSAAYGTEEMLNQMVPFVGVAAFTLVMPVTFAILAVLFFVTLSYLEVIQVYTKAGGSYVVARENFGPKVAQLAAVALLIDYTVTVAVQTAAGTAALTSMFPHLLVWRLTVPISVAMVLLLLYGNLRGIREAGTFFAFPTYFFIGSLGLVIVVGYVRAALGQLHAQPLPPASVLGYTPGHPGEGWLMGLSVLCLLRAFANGGSSLTGLEAISNGVQSFRRPEAPNARKVLVVMATTLAFLVLGVSLLAHWTHAVPYAAGSPTVISQEVRAVLGSGPFADGLYYVVLFATMVVLYTGANTSFNGFPYLTSFVAADSFLPRQLMRRGHRLAFSNGIIVLSIVAEALLLGTGAKVSGLVALFAIGVFSGFTFAGSGMVKHHLTTRGAHWRRGVVVNGVAAVLSASVVCIFVVVKFSEGAWVVVVVAPLLYWALLRLHREYVTEAEQLEVGAVQACEAPVMHRHVVVVLVDRLDMATARAIQYARTLTPDDLRAVHFDLDDAATRTLESEWTRLGLSRLPLDVVECPDRRIVRGAVDLVAEAVADGDTECTVLLPRRSYARGWARFLHDRTADRIAEAVEQVPHVCATIVPFALVPERRVRHPVPPGAPGHPPRAANGHPAPYPVTEADEELAAHAGGARPIAEARWGQAVRVAGRVTSVRVQPRGGADNVECVLSDPSGALLLVFTGRPRVPGVEPGARLVAGGVVGSWGRRLALVDPAVEVVDQGGIDGDGAG